jgi:putative peptidoglycan lipid II flippase
MYMNKKALGIFYRRIKDWSTQSVNRQIFAAASIVGLSTLIVSLLTFVKEILVARQFGTGDALEAFLIAYLLPSLAINVFAGSLNSAFIPTYVRVRETEGDKAAQDLLENVSAFLIFLLFIICLGIALLSPLLFPLIASGFDSEKLQLSHLLFYYLLPLTILKGLSTVWGAVLNTRDKFVLAGIAPVAVPLITIILLLTLVEKWDIYVLVSGLGIGFIIEAGVLGLALKKNGLFTRPRWLGYDRATKEVIQQYLPMIAGAFLMSSTWVVDQAMAAMLRPGDVAALSYGNKVTSFITGLGSMAIGTAVLPYFSSMVAGSRWDEVKNTIVVYLKLIVIVTVPLTLIMIVFSAPLIEVIFQRGAFTSADTALVGKVQAFYFLQIPFYIMGILIVRLISAIRANQILMWAAVMNLMTNIILNLVFIKIWGVAGIALSTSVVYLLSFIYLVIALFLKSRKISQNLQDNSV